MDNINDYLYPILFSIKTEIRAKDKNLLFNHLRDIIYTLITEDTSECILTNRQESTKQIPSTMKVEKSFLKKTKTRPDQTY